MKVVPRVVPRLAPAHWGTRFGSQKPHRGWNSRKKQKRVRNEPCRGYIVFASFPWDATLVYGLQLRSEQWRLHNMLVKVPDISGIPEIENAIKSLILSFSCSFFLIKPPISWNPEMSLSHACLSVGLSACLSICLSVSLFLCPSAYLSVSFSCWLCLSWMWEFLKF